MQQEDRIALPRLGDVHAQPAGVDVAMLDAGDVREVHPREY